jgi:TolB protein
MIRRAATIALAIALIVAGGGCDVGASAPEQTSSTSLGTPIPPEQPPDRWAIYALDLDTGQTNLIHSHPYPIEKMRVNATGDRLVFSQAVGGGTYEDNEIFTIDVDGQNLTRLTDNDVWDLYPAWSPDGSSIAFLSFRDADLDLYIMNSDGSDQRLLFDSGNHDADLQWQGDLIAFTSGSRIWLMNSDGSEARPITDPPRGGEWGKAVLPFGDYDPRISPDGTQVEFSRLIDDASEHGNYDLFLVDIDGTNLVRLTETGYTQGVADWSHDGERLIYILAAIDSTGLYDTYMMNADGTANHNVTPDHYPDNLVIHWAIFSPDDTTVYFVGEWW